MTKPIYDDGEYMVTSAIVSTPRRFYPLAHTSASIRRDPLWGAIAFNLLGGACLFVYGDLLHLHEQVTLIILCVAALAFGREFSILRIAAMGHNGAMIVGRSALIRRLYWAIRQARSGDTMPLPGSDTADQ